MYIFPWHYVIANCMKTEYGFPYDLLQLRESNECPTKALKEAVKQDVLSQIHHTKWLPTTRGKIV